MELRAEQRCDGRKVSPRKSPMVEGDKRAQRAEGTHLGPQWGLRKVPGVSTDRIVSPPPHCARLAASLIFRQSSVMKG